MNGFINRFEDYDTIVPFQEEQRENNQAVPGCVPGAYRICPRRQGYERLVLIVDDNRTMRHMHRVALEDGGCRVLEAADGESALRTFRCCLDPVSVVVLDLDLPGMDGLETAWALRQIRSATRILIVSGALPRFAGSGLSRAVDGCLPKPCDQSMLTAAVECLATVDDLKSKTDPIAPRFKIATSCSNNEI